MLKLSMRLFGAAAILATVSISATAADLDYDDTACLTQGEIAGLNGSGLATAVGADVASNSSCVRSACSASYGVSAHAQQSIGAGIAQAYNQFASQGDAETAGSIADAACTCGGSVSGGFAAGAGNACSVADGSEGTYGGYGTVGNLFYIRSSGGGGVQSQSLN